jgi:Uma2 family endonuclease
LYCIVLAAKQLIYFPKLNFSVYPDVLVVCEAPQYFDDNQVLLINPILVVEVLSRSTGKYDRTTKFDEYKTLDSFKEYVLIDQKKCRIETRFQEEPGLWREKVYTNLSDSILLKSVDCAVEASMIYRKIEI